MSSELYEHQISLNPLVASKDSAKSRKKPSGVFSIVLNIAVSLEAKAQIASVCQLSAGSAPNYKSKASVTFGIAFGLSYGFVSFHLRF